VRSALASSFARGHSTKARRWFGLRKSPVTFPALPSRSCPVAATCCSSKIAQQRSLLRAQHWESCHGIERRARALRGNSYCVSRRSRIAFCTMRIVEIAAFVGVLLAAACGGGDETPSGGAASGAGGTNSSGSSGGGKAGASGSSAGQAPGSGGAGEAGEGSDLGSGGRDATAGEAGAPAEGGGPGSGGTNATGGEGAAGNGGANAEGGTGGASTANGPRLVVGAYPPFAAGTLRVSSSGFVAQQRSCAGTLCVRGFVGSH